MPDEFKLTMHELESAARDVRSGLPGMHGSTDRMPSKVPDLGALTPAFGSVVADLTMATANTVEVVERAGDDLDKCVQSYARHEEATADVFKNIQRDK